MERSYDKKFNLRLPGEIFDRIEEFGRKYDISVNEQMVYMLRTWQEPSVLEDRLARLGAYNNLKVNSFLFFFP
jgi:hypothetical protein